jgi:tetratricopeptide (TPR) repeat protein
VIAHSRRDYAGCVRCWVLSGNVDAVKNLESLLEEQGRSNEFPGILSKMETPAAKHRLGRMQYERGSMERAEELFRQAGSKEAWADLGVLMVQQGRLDEAEQCFRIGKDAPFNLGLLFWQHCVPARLGDAELCFLRSGTPQAWCNLGRIYESQSQWTQALEAFMRSGTEQAWVSAAVLYLRSGHGRDAEKLFRILATEHDSVPAKYYLQSIFLARGHRRDAAGLNLPPLTAEEQLKKFGVVQGFAQQFRFAKATPGVPSLQEMQERQALDRQRRRTIRISTFDENDREILVAAVSEEQAGEDVYLAAFRVRMECDHARQDVEVVEHTASARSRALALAHHGGRRMAALRRRQIQIRDWLVYGCSCTPRGGLFRSPDRLPVESANLDWPLRQVVLHPAYQMQTLELVCSDGSPKIVECGIIRNCEWSIKVETQEKVCVYFFFFFFESKKIALADRSI